MISTDERKELAAALTLLTMTIHDTVAKIYIALKLARPIWQCTTFLLNEMYT